MMILMSEAIMGFTFGESRTHDRVLTQVFQTPVIQTGVRNYE